MKLLLFATGLLLLIGVEITRVYYIMPFPGSQIDETVQLAYFVGNYIWLFRVLGILLIGYPAFKYITGENVSSRATVISLLVFWLIVAYAFNFRFLAEKMFYQPEHKILAKADQNKIDKNQLVLGLSLNGEAKAYPIEIIGYHHQVCDTLGGQAIMVTYCTVCRTGRAYSPLIDGMADQFRLVGMDHFNAMFEDSRTKSWWRQVNGEAIAGPLKGKILNEVPSFQMTLEAWLSMHPDSYILQQDKSFLAQYEGLKDYDEGKTESKLEMHDRESWHDKSWVVGIANGLTAKAYDWNDLIKLKVINDQIDNASIVIAIEKDSASFHAFSRIQGKDTLKFTYDSSRNMLVDQKNNSWSWSGECKEGQLSGAKLNFVQAYQEYWHSWRTFHPQTEKYLP